jgi:glycerol-3-phosphate dehydrogenase (NAD(P)+)
MAIQRIAVLGGGAWGTALALTCARAGRDVVLWEHEADNAASLAQKARKPFSSRRTID